MIRYNDDETVANNPDLLIFSPRLTLGEHA